jgi:small-conductance mechanosensitive channel
MIGFGYHNSRLCNIGFKRKVPLLGERYRKNYKNPINSTGGDLVLFIKITAFLLALLMATAQFSVTARAQNQTTGEAEAPETAKASNSLKEDIVKNPLKPPDTSSPRATLHSFLHNINRAYTMLMAAHNENLKDPGLFTSEPIAQMERQAEILLQRSAYCLNLSGVPDGLKQDVGYEGAIKLKEIFDRIELPPFEKIPDAKAIEVEEELEKVVELDRWRIPNTAIIIAKVEQGLRRDEYLFDEATVARLDEFYGKIMQLPYKRNGDLSYGFLNFYTTTPGLLLPPKWYRWLPAWSNAIYFKQPIWQWAALVIFPLFALLVVWIPVRWWHRKAVGRSPIVKFVGWILIILVAAMTVILVRYVLDEHVNITGSMLMFVENTLQKIFILLLAGIVLWEVMKSRIQHNIKEEGKEEEPAQQSWQEEMGAGGSRRETLLLLMRKFLMVVILAIVCLLLLSAMGINIGPLLAGAGVIGLAIGFGAQTLVKDIIAGIFFLMDDAFRVGDYIEVGTMKGRVEHISVRSLRLRHPRGMLITVPFGDMQSVTNYTRDYVIMKLDFRVRYDTDVEKVRKIIKKISKEIHKDEELNRGLLDKIKSQGVREMDDSAMIMRVKFVCVPGEQFVIRREVYRRIQEAFQKNGIEFAHRNVTVYFPPDSDTSESDNQTLEKKTESETRDQKKKEAAAAAALRTIEEEQMPEDKPR